MDNLSEDQKIVDLLTKLKNSNGGYPSDMLAARRRTYLRQMANVGLGIGIGAGLKETLRGGSNGAATTLTGKIIEIALVAAIALEAGTAAYLYREKITRAIQLYNNSARAQEVTSPSTSDETNASDPSLIEAVDTPLATTSPTPTATPSGTSSTSVAESNQNSDNNNSANTGLNANSTPNPGENQGNQYGLTPKPVRTTDNNGGGGGEGNNSDNGGGGSGGGNNNGNGGGNNNKP
jgi:hypothetical protein